MATAAGLILAKRDRILTVIRAKDPAREKLALPGGFVDPGESAEEAVCRECLEEIGWQPKNVNFLASFPNTYTYRSVPYSTCDLYFLADASELDESTLNYDPDEVSGIRWLDPPAINPSEIAFDSTLRAIQHYASWKAGQVKTPSPL